MNYMSDIMFDLCLDSKKESIQYCGSNTKSKNWSLYDGKDVSKNNYYMYIYSNTNEVKRSEEKIKTKKNIHIK